MNGRTWACVAGVVWGAGAAVAAPLRGEHLPGDARWVAHVDLEALSGSRVGGFVLDLVDAESDGYGEIRQVLDGFTLAPEGGMAGITVFGHDLVEDGDFVALVYGDERIEGWGESIDRTIRAHHVEPQRLEVDGRRAWVIPMEEGGQPLYASMLSSGDRRVWVIAPGQERLEGAVGRVRGRAGEGLVGVEWGAGTLAFARVLVPSEFAGDEEVSRLLGQARELAVRVSEEGGRVRAEAMVVTDDERRADSMVRVIDGLLALGMMMNSGEDEELAALMELVNGVEVGREGARVRVSVTQDAERVVGFLHEAMERGGDGNDGAAGQEGAAGEDEGWGDGD